MPKAKLKTYDLDFKQMMVELYQKGAKVTDLSRDYGVSTQAIHQWIRLYKPDEKGNTQAELMALKKQLKDLQEDNEILKKALTIFAQKSNQK
jgi:transposase